MRGPSTRPARLGLETLEARHVPATTNFLAFGAAPGGLPLVEVFRSDGTSLGRFQAFEDSFRGGVRAAVVELDGNPNTVEVAAVPGPGGGPLVRVFQIDVATLQRTELLSQFVFNPDFRGGLRVAAGNVAGPDNRQEVIVGADAGGGPRVRVLNFLNGTLTTAPGPLGDFFAMDPAFTGGVRVTAGELDGNLLDGDELVVGAGETGGPRVQVFRSDGAVLADFFAFRSDFRGGVQVSFDRAAIVGRLSVDALALDPSQRNVALNAAAVQGLTASAPAVTTTVPATNTAGGVVVAPGTAGTIGTGFSATRPLGTTVSVAGSTASVFFGTVNTAPLFTPISSIGTLTPTGVGTSGPVTTATTGFTAAAGTNTSPVGATGATAVGVTTPTTIGFTAFGDPGPLAVFPPLAVLPFTGPPIGLPTFVFATFVATPF